MSQNTPEIDTQRIGSDRVDITLYPDDSPTKALRQIGYGVTPFVLVETEYTETNDSVVWTVTGSWVESLDELVEVMEAALDVVKAAIEQNRENGTLPQ